MFRATFGVAMHALNLPLMCVYSWRIYGPPELDAYLHVKQREAEIYILGCEIIGGCGGSSCNYQAGQDPVQREDKVTRLCSLPGW